MKAYVRAGSVEHALHGPLGACLGTIADHLGGRAKTCFERIATIDRERTRGEHAFDRLELLELITLAYDLLRDPPVPIRKLRRLAVGPLPAAERIAVLRDWLHACREREVIYDLWRSVVTSAS
jgi:hypothetical protein